MFDTDRLEISLLGNETVFMQIEHVKRRRKKKKRYTKDHHGYFQIIDVAFPLQVFPDGPPPPGQMTFPFSIQLPDWLPASMAVGMKTKYGRLSVEYHLVAQFVPKNKQDWADKEQTISSFYCGLPIYVYRPMN